jgi:hypothetical protein
MLKNLTANERVASKRGILIALFITVLAVNAVMGQQRSSSTSTTSNRSAQQSANDATVVFRAARDLIPDGEWARAQAKFDEYVKAFPNEKNIEAALYWLAYTQQKLAKYDQVRATIDRLLQQYPNTNWKEDARMLLAQQPGVYIQDYPVAGVPTIVAQTPAPAFVVQPPQMPQPPQDAPIVYSTGITTPMAITPMPPGIGPAIIGFDGFPGSGNDDDPCEFKIVVLQALFQTDLQRGIMAATEWLKPGSTQTTRCKSAALSLLGRNGGKSVTPVILGVARNEPDLKLRARAISALGATNDDSVIDALRDFALNSPENEIVEASVYALNQQTSDRAIAVLTDIATQGKTISTRKFAISSISVRPGEPAVDALFKIYDADQNLEIRKAVVSAFANRKSERAGNRLFEIARSSDNIELRKAAINSISRRGGDKATEFLLSLYDTEKNEEVKDQIMNALGAGTSSFFPSVNWEGAPGQAVSIAAGSRMNDERVITKMIEIARDQKAPMERRKRAIGWLSRSKNPKVLEFLQELLKQ